ncbi:RE1-silencing transcription factor-like isoform X1 [Phycodurus eques]|uniref:RE1-silencing transcription factor-like isoform X1 n=1 Tax=Phycodurus eques TaxID=693459 RepID=UPI002ACDFC3D|nr:RE1-silencing transcription factor-like isoform X1 [Phycodurus eques]XP_061550199.1 RE1-silencing transcription factor-like isoform X1 [Phycodurus eques]
MTTHTRTSADMCWVKSDDSEPTSRSAGDGATARSWTRRFRDVDPIPLQLQGGPASARLYCDVIDGLAEAGGLAEVFLVEIFRCKVCRFTCGLKSAICSHLLLAHASPEEAGLQRPALTYALDLKHDDDDFLLYDMLRDIDPPACHIDAHAGLKVTHNCEVSSLFEDDESIFPVKTAFRPADPPAVREEAAQSAHLMTLGLCRIAAARPQPEPGAAHPARPTSDPPLSKDGEKDVRKDAWRAPERRHARRRVRDVHQRRSAERRAELKLRGRRPEAGQRGAESHDLDENAGKSRRAIGGADGKKKITTHLDSSCRRSSTDRQKKERGELAAFVCSLCHKKLSSKVTLQRHLGVHTGIKLFSCPTCSYTSRLKESLQQHVRTHTGEKPFRCASCPYASIDRSSLVRHSRTHSQEKPYKCSQCDYSSIQKKSLDLHARRHHTGETFPCQQCDYASADRQLLLRHTRRHHHHHRQPHASSHNAEGQLEAPISKVQMSDV